MSIERETQVSLASLMGGWEPGHVPLDVIEAQGAAGPVPPEPVMPYYTLDSPTVPVHDIPPPSPPVYRNEDMTMWLSDGVALVRGERFKLASTYIHAALVLLMTAYKEHIESSLYEIACRNGIVLPTDSEGEAVQESSGREDSVVRQMPREESTPEAARERLGEVYSMQPTSPRSLDEAVFFMPREVEGTGASVPCPSYPSTCRDDGGTTPYQLDLFDNRFESTHAAEMRQAVISRQDRPDEGLRGGEHGVDGNVSERGQGRRRKGAGLRSKAATKARSKTASKSP